VTIRAPNRQTRFPGAVKPHLSDPRNQYVLLDIGARIALQPAWKPLTPIANVVGFEPDAEECARLNEKYSLENQRVVIHAKAIAGRTGTHPFYVTQSPDSSGLYRGNAAWVDRFPFTTLKVSKEIRIDAVTLDQFAQDARLDHVDFIKIDVEGAEHDVLCGGLKMLAQQRVLGIFTEFWWDPIIKGQHGFADIDTLVRGSGFRFFDLDLHRYSRSTLPAGRVETLVDGERRVADIKKALDKRAYGQAWTGDALYFRDPVGELKAGALNPMWDKETLLRLCGLMDLYDYGDCAIEVLETFRSTHLAEVDVDRLMDALVPAIEGQIMPYDEYRSLSIRVRQLANKHSHHGLTDWQPPPTGYVPK